VNDVLWLGLRDEHFEGGYLRRTDQFANNVENSHGSAVADHGVARHVWLIHRVAEVCLHLIFQQIDNASVSVAMLMQSEILQRNAEVR